MAAVYRPGLMPAKRTIKSLAMRSGMTLFRAARSWALVGFQGMGKIGFIGWRSYGPFYRLSDRYQLQ